MPPTARRSTRRMLAGVTQPLAAAAKTPIGPVATSIGNAFSRTARNFNSAGHIKVVNFPGGGAVRVTDANIVGPNGARARVFGGSGVTYYWPAGGLRIDGDIEMAGGGLPQGRVSLRQPRAGAPMSGVADLAPYAANGHAPRADADPLRPRPGRLDRSSAPSPSSTARSPTAACRRCACRSRGRSAAAAALPSALRARWSASTICRLSVAPARADAAAGVPDRAGDHLQAAGRPGAGERALQRPGAQWPARQLAAPPAGGGRADRRPAVRLQQPRACGSAGSSSPVLFDAARLTGTFAARACAATFGGAKATIGNVPLLLSDGGGQVAVPTTAT